MDDFNKHQKTPDVNPTDHWQSVNVEEGPGAPFPGGPGEPSAPGEPGPYGNGQSSFYSNAGGPSPRRPGGRTGIKIFILILCVILVLVLLVIVGFISYNQGSSTNHTASSSEASSQQSSAALNIQDVPQTVPSQPLLADGEMETEDIAVKVMPSVVGIEVLYTDASGSVVSGGGSGIIMSTDGYIITNAHVVLNSDTLESAEKIDIHLDNGEIYEGRLVGADTKTDLAVVKIQAQNLVMAEFGDSSALKVGEKAIAIGNPGGTTLASSLTQGVISGVNRVISKSSAESTTYIQTDAAINPGNSGGALVNQYGQVVGINTAKIVMEAYEGIGFAIPINEAKPIIDSIVRTGYVTGRVRIGITFTPISESMAELLKVPVGMRVISVEETADAYTQGVQKGDIITKVEGQPVADLDTVKAILNGRKPGEQVKLTIYRAQNTGEKTFEVSVALQEDTSGKAVTK